MSTAFETYCEEIAEFYLLLRDADDGDRARSIQSSRSGRRTFSWFSCRLTDEERKNRKQWRERMKALLEPDREAPVTRGKLSGQNREVFAWMDDRSDDLGSFKRRLKYDLELLNHVLHALDRGDETYFLYLTLEVKKINEWLRTNCLRWSGNATERSPAPPEGIGEPNTVADSDKRIAEAWPWTEARRQRADLRERSRKLLNDPDPVFVDSKGKKHIGEEARRLHQECIDQYFDFCRQWEFLDKVRSWKEAEGGNLENLVFAIFRKPSDGDLLGQLADLLFRSPKDQSKLALLLGKTPSRWLREEEAESICLRRQLHSDPWESEEGPAMPPDLTGLCFSGGGIRSATFNLGILQALAELRLLDCFDYLSTVSGGGYIHQWIAAWWKRESASAAAGESSDGRTTPFETVRKALVMQPVSTLPGIEPTQISFLRRFSNYLTPRAGAFTADTWTLVAIWMRNTFLNQMIIVSGLIVIFCVLRAAMIELGSLAAHASELWRSRLSVISCLAIFLLALVYVVRRIWIFTWKLDNSDQKAAKLQPRQGDLHLTLAVWLLLFSALLFTAICSGATFDFTAAGGQLGQWLVILASWPEAWGLFMALALWPALLGWFGFSANRYGQSHPESWVFLRRLWAAASGVVSAFCVTFLLATIFRLLWMKLPHLWFGDICASQNVMVQKAISYIANHIDSTGQPALWRELEFLFVPPVLIAALFLVSVLHVGLNKQTFRDEVLEWMARLRALGFLISFAWLVVAGLAVLAGPFVATMYSFGIKAWWTGATALWGIISASGAFAAKSTPDADELWFKQYGRQALILIAPYVFMFGLFVIVSALVSVMLESTGQTLAWRWGLLTLGSAIVCGLYGWQVDINEMSMHSFYRNRLARCYQGASVIDRQPDPFTGFSSDDRAIRLGELRYHSASGSKDNYPGPFPIFSCTLNFTSGEDLAWQERKGTSFAYTPLYSGYDIAWTGADESNLYFSGFRDTTDLGHPYGPGLAEVCAISGAAVSPARGHNTSTGSAFLMTCFNVRLGVWARNTRHPMRSNENRRLGRQGLKNQSPHFAPLWLAAELFGQTDAKKEYLYLTDGGHFDNMGLYELVRRECRYIVICDAEQDGNLDFGGIAMAIRKCRTDFGVDIDLDLRAIRKTADAAWSGVHCVVGTIAYPNEDPDTPSRYRGKIVYLKSTLTGAEPADLLSYKLEHTSFPHDTTADQWFSESQFESYRVLGRYIALNAFTPACEKKNGGVTLTRNRRVLFDRLYDAWYPVTPNIEKHFAGHHEKFEALIKELRSKDDYALHANEIFHPDNDSLSRENPPHREYFEAFAQSLFEFMWQIFNDLDLHIPANQRHPHGQLWMNTFKRWGQMKFVLRAWPIYRERYPRSFRFFMKEHFQLE